MEIKELQLKDLDRIKFKNKNIYFPCDNSMSELVNYFYENFKRLGIKKVFFTGIKNKVVDRKNPSIDIFTKGHIELDKKTNEPEIYHLGYKQIDVKFNNDKETGGFWKKANIIVITEEDSKNEELMVKIREYYKDLYIIKKQTGDKVFKTPSIKPYEEEIVEFQDVLFSDEINQWVNKDKEKKIMGFQAKKETDKKEKETKLQDVYKVPREWIIGETKTAVLMQLEYCKDTDKDGNKLTNFRPYDHVPGDVVEIWFNKKFMLKSDFGLHLKLGVNLDPEFEYTAILDGVEGTVGGEWIITMTKFYQLIENYNKITKK